MALAAAELNERFGLEGRATVIPGNGGCAKVVISTPECSGEMYLHGAHVTSWKPAEHDDVLYLSPNSLFQEGRAIRGGIPVCFPWFGDKTDAPAAPAHGFVRTKEWQLDSIEAASNSVVVRMSTQGDAATKKWWPHDFRLFCRATFGAQLKLELVVTNSGESDFKFEEALHAYFAVKSAESALVRGLDASRYIDKTDHRAEKVQTGDVHFCAETDRIYLDPAHELELLDTAVKRSVSVVKQNSDTAVVWNPWSEKSAALKDLGIGEWRRFVCVETTNVIPCAISLEPSQSHTMTMSVQTVQSPGSST